MKKILFFISIMALTNDLFSQSVGIGTNTPNSSAQLEIKSNTKGILIPRTSSVTRAAIVGPAKSLLLYDTVTNSFWFHNGSDWIESGRIDPPNINTFFGFQTGSSINLGAGNTGIGHQALSGVTDGGFNTALGFWSLLVNTTGNSNTAVGSNSMRLNTTGIENTAIGATSLFSNTTGKDNIAMGNRAMNYNTVGNNNSALGDESLLSNISGNNNVAAGFRSLNLNTAGSDNVAIGANTLFVNGTGYGNVAIGSGSLFANSSGHYNVAVGDSAMFHLNTTNGSNTAVGGYALFTNVSGTRNVAIGDYSLYYNTSSLNQAIGSSALQNNTTGSGNVAIGDQSMTSNITGFGNVAIGYISGSNIQNSNNTVIGSNSSVSPSTVSGSTALGYNAIVSASNKVRLGSPFITTIEGQVAYSFPSDGRFKFNISDEDLKGLDFIMRLHPVNYQFDTKKFDAFLKSDLPNAAKINDQEYEESTSIIHNGFVAQEVEQAMKESGFNFDGLHRPTNEKDNYSIAYSQFVVPLIKGMQEQQKLIEALQKKNEELERRILLLEKK